MRKFFLSLFSAIALLAVSCTFDDSDIWNEINSLKSRVDALEQLCNQMNTNISALQTIVEALQKNDYVTNIAPITEGGEIIGYTISFSKSDSITIYHGKDGKDGQNGADGKDGYTPQIGVKQDADGLYYWTLDGEWLLDGDGNKIKAQGVDGESGDTPQLKIENDYWYVSYDNGTTWTEVGQATGDDGDSMFEQVTYDDDYVYITLADGTALVLSRSADSAEIPNNEIWYTTTNGSAITLLYPDVFGAKIISNVYEKSGKGIITFDGDVTSIGDSAFYDCKTLTSVTIPDSVTSIGEHAFDSCKSLTSITLPEGVLSIGYRAFKYCESLESITIPDSVVDIGDGVFFCCESLTSITLPDSVTSIGDTVFYGCDALESITIPDGVTSIGYSAFYSCDFLASITIPSGVTSIGEDAFCYCDSLTSITLPDGVTSIGEDAFYGCSSLTTVYSKNTTPPLAGNNMFDNCHSQLKIYVPTSSVSAYQSADGWSEYASIIEGYDFSN